MDGMESLPLPGLLAGRAALVTGAGNGIGRATARHLAAMGATVGVNDLKPEFAEKVVDEITAAGGKAVSVVQNIASRDGIRTAVLGLAERCGRLDVLVNNAAWVCAIRPCRTSRRRPWSACWRWASSPSSGASRPPLRRWTQRAAARS